MVTRSNLIFVLLIVAASSQSYYKLYKHPEPTQAKCLDGSPSALYISQGDPKKILIYFQGGGMCSGLDLSSTIQNCYNRSRTEYGSSSAYTATMNLHQATVLSTDQKINPLYYSWTKVYVPYCDGVLHQGTRAGPIEFKGKLLYMRGMNITLAHLGYLEQRFGIFGMERVVLTGTSAGAMAALSWANVVYKKMKNPQGLLVIFDSGQFFSEYLNPFTNSTPGTDYFKSIKSLAFTEQQPPFTECLQAETRENCDKFGVIVNYVLPPIFAIESEYDLYAIRNILLLRCPELDFPATLRKCNETEMRVIEDYRAKSLESWKNLTKYEKNGLWAISCSQHGFLYHYLIYNTNAYRVPHQTGATVLEALEKFVNGTGRIFADTVAWPNNSGCSGPTHLTVNQFNRFPEYPNFNDFTKTNPSQE